MGPHLVGILLTDPLIGCQSFVVWSGTDSGRSRSLGNEGGGGNDASPVGQRHGPWGVDMLVFLMIRRLNKLDALCTYIANCGDDCNDAGRQNKETPTRSFKIRGVQRKLKNQRCCPSKRCGDFDSDFKKTKNLCKVMQDSERVILREKFASKMAIQMEKQLQQQTVLARTAVSSDMGAVDPTCVPVRCQG